MHFIQRKICKQTMKTNLPMGVFKTQTCSVNCNIAAQDLTLLRFYIQYIMLFVNTFMLFVEFKVPESKWIS